MIARDPYGLSRVERPGRQEEPRTRKAPIASYDTPAQIAMCQHCRKRECDDCISRRKKSGRHAARWAQFWELYRRGCTDGEIAAAMGIAYPSVSYRRKQYALPPNPARRTLRDPCPACKARAVCEAVGGTCNAKARWAAPAKGGSR